MTDFSERYGPLEVTLAERVLSSPAPMSGSPATSPYEERGPWRYALASRRVCLYRSAFGGYAYVTLTMTENRKAVKGWWLKGLPLESVRGRVASIHRNAEKVSS
jgi:hypothetical protein